MAQADRDAASISEDNMISFLKALFFYFLLCLLPLACSSLPVKDDIQTDFLLQMRVGYTGIKQAGSADLYWRQSGSDYDAVLSNRIELARMQRSGENRTLFITEDLRAHIDPENLPLEYLEYWINLMPHPALPAEINRTPLGHIIKIQQDGWEITYQRRKQGFPRLMRATKPPYRVTLVILERKSF